MNIYSAYFKYCPRCQSPSVKVIDGIVDCKSCGFHFYQKPSLTTALILENSKTEILLTKRKYPPKKNYWDLPGGFINFGETVEQCLRREIREELGITLKKVKYFGSFWSYYPYRGIRYQTLCLVFTSRNLNQAIKVGDDVCDYRFFAKKDIDLKKISFGDVRRALRDYLPSFKNSDKTKKSKNKR